LLYLLLYSSGETPVIRLNTSRYVNAAIFAAVLLLGVPLLLRLVLRVPFVTTFTLMAFVCIMRVSLYAWPRNPETGRRYRRWLIPFPRTLGFMLFFGTWWTQPHFGANVCPSKGFMWTTDLVEQVRPNIRRSVSNRSAQQSWLAAGRRDRCAVYRCRRSSGGPFEAVRRRARCRLLPLRRLRSERNHDGCLHKRWAERYSTRGQGQVSLYQDRPGLRYLDGSTRRRRKLVHHPNLAVWKAFRRRRENL